MRFELGILGNLLDKWACYPLGHAGRLLFENILYTLWKNNGVLCAWWYNHYIISILDQHLVQLVLFAQETFATSVILLFLTNLGVSWGELSKQPTSRICWRPCHELVRDQLCQIPCKYTRRIYSNRGIQCQDQIWKRCLFKKKKKKKDQYFDDSCKDTSVTQVFIQDIDSMWQNVTVNKCQVRIFLKFISFQKQGCLFSRGCFISNKYGTETYLNVSIYHHKSTERDSWKCK